MAHTSGLIHDIGKLILDQYVLEVKEAIDAFLQDDQQTFLSAEKQILGFDHAEIAAQMCKRWNIPETVSIAICYHHCPSASQRAELAYILHMADYIAIMSGGGYEADDFLYELEEGTMGFLDIKQEDVGNLTLEVMEAVTKLTD